MEFPKVPHSWDFGPFVLGCFFIFLGFWLSNLWAFFFGILLVEFGLSIFVFILLAYALVGEYANERKQRDFIIYYFIFVLIALIITSFILGYLYFGFDVRSVIKRQWFFENWHIVLWRDQSWSEPSIFEHSWIHRDRIFLYFQRALSISQKKRLKWGKNSGRWRERGCIPLTIVRCILSYYLGRNLHYIRFLTPSFAKETLFGIHIHL